MKITFAQINFRIGDFEHNVTRILEVIQSDNETNEPSDLIVFSELALTGYYPQDLLLDSRFQQREAEALDQVREATRGRDVAVLIGHTGASGDPFRPRQNQLSVLRDGECIFSYVKRKLPTYGVFEERRHFAPGGRAPVVFEHAGQRIGVLICEDGWTDAEPNNPGDPVPALIAEQPDLVVHINASPGEVGKLRDREGRFRELAEQVGCPWLYVNQVGGHDELVYDGGSCIHDPTIGQTDTLGLPVYQEAIGQWLTTGAGEERFRIVRGEGVAPPIGSVDDNQILYNHLVRGLRDYAGKCGFERVVVGCSGGIDSAVTLALAVAALGADNVTAITMPSRYSSAGSVHDSEQLCQALGVTMIEAPIEKEFSEALRTYEQDIGAPAAPVAQENMQARLRGLKVMTYSNSTGALVLTTGNKSEMSVGYATLYGDMAGGLAVLGDLYKMQVYALAHHINAVAETAVIPHSILEKAPSAELAPDQTDQDALPEYPILDAILMLEIEGDLLPESIREDLRARTAGVPETVIDRVERLYRCAEYKRRQAPPILRVQRKAFGQGRHIPIARA